jgi:hypothetical protein
MASGLCLLQASERTGERNQKFNLNRMFTKPAGSPALIPDPQGIEGRSICNLNYPRYGITLAKR